MTGMTPHTGSTASASWVTSKPVQRIALSKRTNKERGELYALYMALFIMRRQLRMQRLKIWANLIGTL